MIMIGNCMNYTNDEILIATMAEDVKFPTKREEDGCFDIYPYFAEDKIVIPPHCCKLIPTGIKSAFDKQYRIALRERGSSSKSNHIIKCGQIDSGYRGEWFVCVYNGNVCDLEITKEVKEVEKNLNVVKMPYTKAIAQFAVEYVPPCFITKVDESCIEGIDSQRGSGALGSSGK